MFQWKTTVHPCGILQYLATVLQIKVSNYSPISLTWHHWALKPPFSRSPASRGWMTGYKLQRNHHQRSWMGNLHACYYGGHWDSSPEHQMPSPKSFKLQTRKCVRLTLPVLLHPLKMLSVQQLEIFSVVCPLDAETGFPMANLSFPFIFVDIRPLHDWLLYHPANILHNQASTDGVVDPKWTQGDQRRNGLKLFRGKNVPSFLEQERVADTLSLTRL